MPTDGRVSAIVFGREDGPSWPIARTRRALSALGVTMELALGPASLIAALGAAAGPRWLIAAGAVPLGSPRAPPRSATGHALLALGATQDDAAWQALLAATGGMLTAATPLPPVRSVFVERPAALAVALTSTVSLQTKSSVSDSISLASSRLPQGVRRVRVSGFDVAFTETPHVVELVTTLHRGGAERIALDLTHGLDRLGLDVTLAVLDRASRTTFEAPPGAIFLDDHAATRTERLEALGALAVAAGVDLVHAHLLNGEDLRILAASGIPLVTTIHNSRPGWPAKLDVLGASDVALTIACSRDIEVQLAAAKYPGIVRTIWNGITPARAAPRAPGPVGILRLLVVANHRPQKRLERLPVILAALRQRGHDARLLVVGEPVKADRSMEAIAGRVRDEAIRHGVADFVEIRGSASDVAALYAAHDVVVSASAFEGLSLVHLEALAAGVPLVTTAVAGTEELVRKHPHAVVVPLDASAEDFAVAIEMAIDPARPRPSLAPDFTSAKMSERHADLFRRVLSTPRPAQRRGLVLVANNFSTGGAQSSARRLLVTLAAAGVAVRAVVLQEQEPYPTPGRRALRAAGIDVFVAPRAGDVDPLVSARAIAEAVEGWQPEALLFWNVISQHKVLLADLLLDTPIWDVSPGEMYFASFARYLVTPRVGSPYLSLRDYGRRLAGVIVKYEGERVVAEEALGTAVSVVPNGVAVPAAAPVRTPGERVVIGTLARLGVDKKLEQLVDAVAHASARGLFASCELRIAGPVETGDEAYVQGLRERSRELPITWVGEQDATAFLATLDVFAMVSEPSGCPNASIEAMASGLAVVATEVGGAGEQIVHGETGLLVPRGDAAALGAAIAALAHDAERRAAMGRAGHARALAYYDVRRMARDYARICLGSVPLALAERTSAARLPVTPDPTLDA